MDPEGAERFKQELAKAKRYVEFGSGGTTILADRAQIHTLSIENDRFYARAVASRLAGARVKQVVIRMGPTREWGYPFFPNRRKARAYVAAASSEPAPDFVLIDGRYRVACALEAARQAKLRKAPATLFFDDYAGRPHYRSVERFLGPPEMAGRAAVFRIGHQFVPENAVEASLDDRR